MVQMVNGGDVCGGWLLDYSLAVSMVGMSCGWLLMGVVWSE